MLWGLSYQEHLFRSLIDGGRLTHAYLFFGDPGIGKRTFSEHLAAFLEFGVWGAPAAPFLDARWFSRTSNSSSFGIGGVREIRKFLYQTPLRSPRRLAVLDEAEDLTPEAQSALLKVVEEPPPHGLMIFIAEQERTLIPPLTSRLQKIYFPRLREQKLERVLEEQYGFSGRDAVSLSRRSFGRIGRALMLGKRQKEESLDSPFETFDRAQSRDNRRELLYFLRERIAELYASGPRKASNRLLELIRLEVALECFPLNINLQRKVASFLEKG